MANRSDRTSAFPRAMKRIWLLTAVNESVKASDLGLLKSMMIESHGRHRKVVRERERRSVADVVGGDTE